MACAASIPLFDSKIGYHDQRLPAGTAPKQDQRLWDRAMTWPEQILYPLLTAKQATMTSACGRGKAAKEDERLWERALTRPEQPPCPFF